MNIAILLPFINDLEKVPGGHQHPSCFGDEEWQIHIGLQIYSQIPPIWQSETHTHLKQLPSSSEVRNRVLRHVGQDWCSSLPRKYVIPPHDTPLVPFAKKFTLSQGNIDLGTACGKYFRVSTLSITDPGNVAFLYLPNYLFSHLQLYRRLRHYSSVASGALSELLTNKGMLYIHTYLWCSRSASLRFFIPCLFPSLVFSLRCHI